MKKLLVAAVLLACLCPGSIFAGLEDDLKYLGYTDDTTTFAEQSMRHPKKVISPPLPTPPAPTVLDEANAVTDQLAELGRTRSLTPDMADRSHETKAKLDQYWSSMKPNAQGATFTPLSQEFKNELKQRLYKSLYDSGFEVKQLDLVDVENAPRVRAVVRVVRPLKTNNPYQEIQENLAQVKSLCVDSGTVDGVGYLSEMTTFVAENPQNKYYYEKTILNP